MTDYLDKALEKPTCYNFFLKTSELRKIQFILTHTASSSYWYIEAYNQVHKKTPTREKFSLFHGNYTHIPSTRIAEILDVLTKAEYGGKKDFLIQWLIEWALLPHTVDGVLNFPIPLDYLTKYAEGEFADVDTEKGIFEVLYEIAFVVQGTSLTLSTKKRDFSALTTEEFWLRLEPHTPGSFYVTVDQVLKAARKAADAAEASNPAEGAPYIPEISSPADKENQVSEVDDEIFDTVAFLVGRENEKRVEVSHPFMVYGSVLKTLPLLDVSISDAATLYAYLYSTTFDTYLTEDFYVKFDEEKYPERCVLHEALKVVGNNAEWSGEYPVDAVLLAYLKVTNS